MDRPGVFIVPEGRGEHIKMEETGCEIIFGASTTLAVRGLMMIMMILLFCIGCVLYWQLLAITESVSTGCIWARDSSPFLRRLQRSSAQLCTKDRYQLQYWKQNSCQITEISCVFFFFLLEKSGWLFNISNLCVFSRMQENQNMITLLNI